MLESLTNLVGEEQKSAQRNLILALLACRLVGYVIVRKIGKYTCSLAGDFDFAGDRH